MIHITLSAERRVDPALDGLGRDRVGYSPTMSPGALYDANHGEWVLGPRAHRERYALLSFEGTVVQGIEIRSIEVTTKRDQADRRDDRSTIHGTILQPGHPVYEKYVRKPSPIGRVRNPVTYIDEGMGYSICRCGCGKLTERGDFLSGHDQVALHQRVREIGTVSDFLDWFDTVRGPSLPGTPGLRRRSGRPELNC